MKENLNIDYHTHRYLVEALIRSKDIAGAAKLLEVSQRSVFRYMDKFGVNYKDIKKARKERNNSGL